MNNHLKTIKNERVYNVTKAKQKCNENVIQKSTKKLDYFQYL